MSSTDSSASGKVMELAEEFLDRYRRGERPALADYAREHPDLADEIREVFPAMAMMENIAIGDQSLDADSAGAQAEAAPEIRQLGDFRILREVGRGGMGIVYEAEQLSLGRRVALKVLPQQMLLDGTRKRRFEREAKAAAKLHHTNIVPVFGVGEQDGLHFYIMQFIRGLGIDEVVRELKRLQAGPPTGTAPPPSADAGTASHHEAAAEQIARSLVTGEFQGAGAGLDDSGAQPRQPSATTAAQSREGANHEPTTLAAGGLSDTFPGSSSIVLPGSAEASGTSRERNKVSSYWHSVARIGRQVADALQYAHDQGILHRDIKPSNLLLDARGTVWVTDFGLAKTDDQMDITASGDVLGTLRYMPPEAFEGKTGATGDVYSLGLTLYELLTFRPAFAETDRGKLVRQMSTEDPDRLGTVNPRIPRDLETIVHKAIERDPSHRYRSSGALAADLQRFLDDEPIAARRLTRPERVVRWSRRHKAVSALLATLAAVLLFGFAGMTFLWIQAEESATKAVALADKETKARAEAQAQAALATERAKDLVWQDYINRVNRAYREIQDDNAAQAGDLLLGCPIDHRGWEWRYVMRLCHSERLTIDAGGQSVNAIAYSPDGSMLAIGSGRSRIGLPGLPATDAQRVELRDATTGLRLKDLVGPGGDLYSLAFSPDGRRLAVGTGFRSPGAARLTVWDVESGQIAWEQLEPGVPAVTSVAYSPDGAALVAGYGAYSWMAQGKVKLWDSNTGTETATFPGPIGGVNDLAYHPDGSKLAVSGFEVVEVWAVDGGSLLHSLPGHVKWVYALAFSRDGRWLASGGWDRTIKLRDAATGAERLTLFGHAGFVYDLAFSADSRSLASGGEDRGVRLWEVPSGRRLSTFHGHTDFIWSVAFRPGAGEIASGSMEGKLNLWDLQTSRPVVFEGHGGWPTKLAYRRDGARVLSLAPIHKPPEDSSMGWNPRTGERDPSLDGASLDIPPGDYAAGAVYRGTHHVADAKSPDGQLVAQVIRAIDGTTSARSRRYAGNAVEIRETATGAVVHTLIGHSGEVTCFLFSPDGRRLATASNDSTTKLWDTETGREVFTLRGHTAGVVGLVFGPDGHRLVTGGIDTTARVWDATPLPEDLSEKLQTAYRRKITALTEIKGVRDEAQRAEILFRNEQFDLAAEAYRKAIDTDRENAQLHLNLGQALNKLGLQEEADAAFRNAIEVDAERSASLFYGIKRYDLAVEAYRRTIEREPENARFHHNLAGALSLNGMHDDANAAYLKAAEFGPKEPWYHRNLGFALSRSGKHDEAIAEYRKAVELHPKNLELHLDLGNALSRLGKHDEAIAAYRKAVELDPKNSGLHRDLGWMLSRSGKHDEAIAALRKAVELDPKNVQLHLSLGRALSKQGMRKEAYVAFRKAIEVDPSGLSSVFFRSGRFDLAIEAYRRAAAEPLSIEEDPTNQPKVDESATKKKNGGEEKGQ